MHAGVFHYMVCSCLPLGHNLIVTRWRCQLFWNTSKQVHGYIMFNNCDKLAFYNQWWWIFSKKKKMIMKVWTKEAMPENHFNAKFCADIELWIAIWTITPFQLSRFWLCCCRYRLAVSINHSLWCGFEWLMCHWTRCLVFFAGIRWMLHKPHTSLLKKKSTNDPRTRRTHHILHIAPIDVMLELTGASGSGRTANRIILKIRQHGYNSRNLDKNFYNRFSGFRL